MRHRHTAPPSPGRVAAAVRGARSLVAAAAARSAGRLGLGLTLLSLVTGFVLAAPVVSGTTSAEIDVDSTAGDSLVVMGLDGRPTSATFARASTRLTLGPDGVQVDAPASRSERMVPTPVPAGPAPSAPETPVSAGPAEPAAPESPPVEDVPEGTTGAELPSSTAPDAPAGPRAVLPAAPPPPAAPAAADRAGQVLALVNQERAAAGCRPVTADDDLAGVAAAHSADMRDRAFFDHVNPAGQSPFDRAEAAGVSARAENIARGQADAAAVMDSWMASPGHRANIVDCSLTRLGVGVADGGGGPWWTQLFG